MDRGRLGNVLETHPEYETIVKMILDRQASKVIVSKLSLPVSPRTVDRFRQTVLKKAFSSRLNTMKGLILKPAEPTIYETPKTPDVIRSEVVAGVANGAAVGSGLLSRINGLIDKRLSRRDRWMADAESSQHVSPDGVVTHNMDHGALARHDANESRDLENMAKLGGLLSDAPQVNLQNLVVFIPPGKQQD